MGYGLGVLLLGAGLVLAFAVHAISGMDLTMADYILAAGGILAIVLTAITVNRCRGVHSVSTTTRAHGSRSLTNRTQSDPHA